ncbi:ribonuclease Y [bacterium]|nr:ribonuclease Y [candidate division CSSED10-310 bacterium]
MIPKDIIIAVIAGLIGLVTGFAADYFFTIFRSRRILRNAKNEAMQIEEKALQDAGAIRKEAEVEAKDKYYTKLNQFEQDTKERRAELKKLEYRIIKREENLERKQSFLDKKERTLIQKSKELQTQKDEIGDLEKMKREMVEEQDKTLQRIAGMSNQEARKIVIERVENDARKEAADTIKKIIDEAKEKAEIKAKEVISAAIQRISSDHVSETTVSVVDLPNDEMKGRIIGREGRNIRALEAMTGVDLIIDDTPEAVIISGFDAIRREIAANSLKRLISDGRIHPARIEEIVAKVEKEVEKNIRETGEQVAFEVGVQGLHPEIIRLLGRLKFRTSYGQNVLNHSKEVAFIAGMMASELGVNIKLAKRAGLLHDIGKAVDHEVEGSHALIGAEIAKKFGEPKEVVRAMAAHHGDESPTTIEAVLIQAADALSAARPGARREILSTYLKRLEKLEDIAQGFTGVDKSYAIQAGREIRIIFRPEDVSDQEMAMTAREIAQRIERELEYPGEIKVTAIRETRSVEYAR